jgi:drug/metabolite transporter (DMT)-like permease
VTCFQWALKNNPTAVVLPVIATTPLVAVPFTYIFEKERPSLKSVIGGAIAVIGVIFLLHSR